MAAVVEPQATATGAGIPADSVAQENGDGSIESLDNIHSWFKPEQFLDADFKADAYVGELRRYVPLDTLKDELDKHLAFLKNRLVEVINEDYNDFVSLSTKLVNVDGSVLRMKIPLSELKDKLEGVRSSIQGELHQLHERLQRRKDIAAAREILDLLQDSAHVASKVDKLLVEVEQHSGNVHGSNLDSRCRLLERVASEVSRLGFYCNKGKGLPFVDEMEPRVSKYRAQLNSHLAQALVASLKERNTSAIFHCFHAYSSLGDSQGAEEAVRDSVVAPMVQTAVAAHSVSGPRSGAGMLSSVLGAIADEVQAQCGFVLDIAMNPQSGLHAFNFLANSILKEVHAALAANLSRAFSPGVPAAFLANYNASLAFLGALEGHCRSTASVDAFRGSDEYTSFLKKWNTSVYFSLRFQDIAGSLDNVIQAEDLALVSDEASSAPQFSVAATACLWSALQKCLSSEVYLPALADRFARLVLQLLGRYRYWLASGLSHRRDQSSAKPGDRTPLASGENLSFAWALKLGAEDLALLRLDVCTLVALLRSEYSDSLKERMEHAGAMAVKSVVDAVGTRSEAISGLGAQIDDAVTLLIADKCSVVLKQIRVITSTFRMTNKPMPTRPSHFISGVLVSLREFLDTSQAGALPEEVRAGIVWLCAERVSAAYAEMADELLTTVRKTEDSLKRLKRGRSQKPGAAGSTASDQASDQEKICMQLFLDAQEYGRQLQSFQLVPQQLPNFKSLWAVVALPDKQEIVL